MMTSERSLIEAGNCDLATAALTYAAAGWPVFPLTPGGKEPLGSLVPHGFQDATTSLSRVLRWWQIEPEANIGHPTGVCADVLDVDVRTSGDGYAALARLARCAPDDDSGRMTLLAGAFAEAETRNGGRHYFYPPSGSGCRAFAKQHLDIKATGGYVLLAPSRVAADEGIDGPGTYRWLEVNYGYVWPLDSKAIAAQLAPRPPHLVVTSPTGGSVDHLAAFVAVQPEGNRNQGLFWAACRAAEEGTLDDGGAEALVAAAMSAGLTEAEARATVKSAAKRVAA